MRIVRGGENFPREDLKQSSLDVYFESGLVRFRQTLDGVVLVDLSEALSHGKECPIYLLEDREKVIDWIQSKRLNWTAILEELSCLAGSPGEGNSGILEIEAFKGQRKFLRGVRMYSPFHHHRLPPLKSAPGKWTVRHALRALVNRQTENFEQVAHGPINLSKDLLRRIVETPHGWRTYAEDGQIYLCCHRFETYRFVLRG